MRLSDFDYQLPESLIADHPSKQRDHSRLLVLDKDSGQLSHRHFFDLINYLEPGDALVLNQSKVFPARLIGEKETGGKVEVLLSNPVDEYTWSAIGRRIKVNQIINFAAGQLVATVVRKNEKTIEIKFNLPASEVFSVLEKIGQIPLPPYIEHKREGKGNIACNDKERYQTVYAAEVGSCAAPTAGLHFTALLLDQIRDKGISVVYLTLHVGLGTFMPVEVENVEEHKMHREYYSIEAEAVEVINNVKQSGGRVVAVGTTTTRVLEHVFSRLTTKDQRPKPEVFSGWTDIFIYPGYQFKCIDGLITNFHLPKSTLLLLVSAFAGREQALIAYDKAIKSKYNFYSYGDAMLIL